MGLATKAFDTGSPAAMGRLATVIEQQTQNAILNNPEDTHLITQLQGRTERYNVAYKASNTTRNGLLITKGEATADNVQTMRTITSRLSQAFRATA